MQTKALEILVGFFICLGIAAVLVLTLRVASLQDVGGSQGGYVVTAEFDNVGKLAIGNAVKIAGVTIGRVQSISVDQDSFKAVVAMKIGSQYNNIPGDVGASILTAGLLGEQYIGMLQGGSETNLAPGGTITITSSAMVLEQLIGKFMTGFTDSNKSADK